MSNLFVSLRERERERLLVSYIFLIVLLFFSFVLTETAYGEGGEQFSVDTLFGFESHIFSNWETWQIYDDGSWNELYVYAKQGEKIAISNMPNPTVIYDNGNAVNLSGDTNSILVNSSNCHSEGCIFKIRPTTDLDSTWDITVSNPNSGQIYNGRMFTFGLVFYKYGSITSTLFILTDTGIIYKEELCVTPIWGFLVATKQGNKSMSGSNIGKPIYHSKLEGTTQPFIHAYPKAEYISVLPDYSMTDSCQKYFFNYPDADLLSYLGLSQPIENKITNLSYERGNTGGTITLEVTAIRGNYQIEFDFGDESKNILTGGAITSQKIVIPWDGKDKQGNSVPNSSFRINAIVTSGETHFINDDFEGMEIVLTQMNGTDAGSDIVYYDNSETTIDGYTIPAVGDWGNHSTDGVHSSQKRPFSNNTDHATFDLWVYQKDDSKSMYISELINIQVNKLWEDESDRDGVRPSTISVKLLQNDAEYDTAAITGSAGNTWTYTFRNLPKYDTNGELFEYAVEELTD